ncbi:MAG: electron transport complex subunit RsxG [Bermanella sp.]
MESNEIQDSEVTLSQSIIKNATGLALFAFITAGIIGLVQLSTSERISENIAQAQAKALYEIVPKNLIDNDLLATTIDLTTKENRQLMNVSLLGNLKQGATAHLGIKDGKVHSVIFPVISKDGYTTDIHMLVGINLSGSVAGVRIVQHKETPGLGDKVETKKSNWVLSFNEKSLSSPTIDAWKVKKDGGEFDQFTGATITPRAVVGAVRKALEFFQAHKETLLQQANTLIKHNDQASQVKS